MIKLYKAWKRRQLRVEARNKINAEREEYKTVQTIPYIKQWSDANPQTMSIVLKQNGYGKRMVEKIGDIYPAKIENEHWYHAHVVPWLNHMIVEDGETSPEKPKKNNVVKLELVKK